MNGIIIINKEKGWTSNDVVQKVKHKLKEKVGHTGTLDPMATGVLPILVGKGTLLSKYLINHDKIYVATLKLGIKTDTGDITGDIVQEKNVDEKCLEEENVRNVLEKIKGEQEQIPPMYSAIKVNGKKLYEYARKGLSIDVSPRKINIYSTEVLNIEKENKEIQFRINCSKGTYIRTLCESIAEKLGTVGTMSSLNREKVGEFELKDAIKISEIENYEKSFITIEKFFEKEASIELDQIQLNKFLNGIRLYTKNKNGIYKIYSNSDFIGCGIVEENKLKRDIITKI